MSQSSRRIIMGRPFGATVLAILIFLRGLLAIFLFLVQFAYGGLTFFLSSQDVGATYLFLAVPHLITGIISLVLSYGLWKTQSWAWMWTVIILGLSLLIDLVIVVFGGGLHGLDLLLSA